MIDCYTLFQLGLVPKLIASAVNTALGVAINNQRAYTKLKNIFQSIYGALYL